MSVYITKEPKYRRIGLTGPASSGKTTLVKYMAVEFGLPQIKEGVREYCASLGLDLATARKDVLNFQEAVRRIRTDAIRTAIQKNGKFVSDRTGLDNLLYTMLYYPSEDNGDFLCGYIQKIYAEMKEMYDLLIIVPPFTDAIIADGFRTHNVGHHVMWQYALHGMLVKTILDWDELEVYFLKSDDLTERKEEIRKLLTK